MNRLMLLDSASLYFRAFFGVPDSLKAPDGTVVNALRGMLDYTATLIERYSPTHLVACWDEDWRPQWRVDLLPSYKTHRVAAVVEPGADIEQVPDLLSPQVPLIAQALELAGIPVVGAPAAEADDVIGTLAARSSCPVDVVTGDRDLFQLVTDDVRVLYTSRGGVANPEIVNESWLVEKYGVTASQYVDFAVLRGDASDGLPGVKGIGEKTAAALLVAHRDLAGIEAAAADPTSALRPAIRTNVLAASGYLAAARQVVGVKQDLDVAEPTALRALTASERDKLLAFATTWGVTGAATRLLQYL